MQAVFDTGRERGTLMLFARRGDRDYMIRSEKRPSYNRGQAPQKRPPRRRPRRTGNGYLLLTLLLGVLLWPVGIFLIWNRRLRCKVGGKLVWSAVTLALFAALIIGVLNVPTDSPKMQAFQDGANDFIQTAWADTKVFAATVWDRTEDAVSNLCLFVKTSDDYVYSKAADAITGGVALAGQAWEKTQDLFKSDSPEPSSAPEATALPADSSASVAPSRTPSSRPGAMPSPEPTDQLPGARSSAGATDRVGPTVDSVGPSTDSVGPTVDSAEPSTDSAEPSTDSAEPSTDSAGPSADSVGPASSPRPAATRTGTAKPQSTAAPTGAPTLTASGAPVASSIPSKVSPRSAAATAEVSVMQKQTSVSSLTLDPAVAVTPVYTPKPTKVSTKQPTVPSAAVSKPTEAPSPAPTVTSSPTATPTPTATSRRATATPAAAATPTISPTPTPAPTPVPARVVPTGAGATLGLPTDAVATPLPTVKPAGEFLVWHTRNGRWYHTQSNCSGMRNASEYTLASSVQAGFDTCPKCSAPPADLLNAQDVVWCDAAQLYHTSDECTDFSGKATLHTLTDAQKDGFEACPLCGAAGRAAETSDR